MMNYHPRLAASAAALIACLTANTANAAIALDRTRAIFNGEDTSISLSISNQNKSLPYLAQAWLEDEKGDKITSPLTAVPPLQRVEPNTKGQVKVQAVNVAALPQDRESLFYFNLREIPPKSSKENTLQIALQTRIKLFYRPKALMMQRNADESAWPEKLTLTREGDKYRVDNPTPYYVTLAGGYQTQGGAPVAGFTPIMVAPKSNALLKGSASALGNAPVLTYINDYGGRPKLLFSCTANKCHVTKSKAG
ncbi:fimbria/pilus periplasmic chaperone [Salmonella enterica]